jgi:uncharacterized membrane protein
MPELPEPLVENRQRNEDAKNNALIAYILMVLGMFTGVFWIIGAVWAMVKKEDAVNTPYLDHYSNIVKTFWWGFFWTMLGIALWVFFIGIVIMFIAWVWAIYRIIKGLARITSDKSFSD